jgi:hypothetical protein
MKEYLALNANISLTEMEDDTLRAVAELILITSEPNYRIDAAGMLVKDRVTEDVRIAFTTKALEKLVEGATMLVEEMHSLEARASIAPAAKEAA